MKTKILLISILCFAFTFGNAQKTINYPAFKTSSRYSLMIEKVEMTDQATILHMRVNYEPNRFWSMSKESYIVVGDYVDKLQVVKAEGINLGERMHTKDGTSLFSLYFPPIDTTTQKIDFIEGDCNTCYRIKGIDLTREISDQQIRNNDFRAVKQTERGRADQNGNVHYRSADEETMASRSSATYDGSPYSLMFAWKKKSKSLQPHWNGVGFALANFEGMENVGADLRASTSYSIVINPIDYKLPLNSHFLLVSGLGLDFSRYHFKGNVGLDEVDGVTKFVDAPEGETYKSSKLVSYYVTVPFLLEYQAKTSANRTFFINAGAVGYVRYYSKSQVDINRTGNVEAVNLGRDLNIRPVNARFMLRAGISDISLYAYYSPLSLFEKNKGPELKPIGMGIMLNF